MRLPVVTNKLKDRVKYKLEKERIHLDSGSCSVFVPIDNNWGVKCYDSKYMRRIAMKRQQKAARYKIGPRCGQPFEIKYKEHEWQGLVENTKYCFITRRAKRVGSIDPFDAGYAWDGIINKTAKRLEKKLRKLNLTLAADDLHGGNIGFIKNRMVCIDFIC